jgi:predicted ATPase
MPMVVKDYSCKERKVIYLNYFSFPDSDREHDFFMRERRTCYDSFYPFQILPAHGLERIDFEPVTVVYGGNGSGKSTVLNVIAEKTKIRRDSVFNKSNFYPDYINMCDMHPETDIPDNSRIITSDDVFDYMLDIRNLNEGIDRKRDEVFVEYLDAKHSDFQLKSLEDYDRLKKVNKSRRTTQSKFVRSELMDNVREYSNGESAYRYFTEKIAENGLYILDEPENSLSPKRQMEFAGFIEDSVRFFGCQFIISTHSPFLLAMRGAKIYDLDQKPVAVKRWTKLENVRIYYEFFKSHSNEFGTEEECLWTAANCRP